MDKPHQWSVKGHKKQVPEYAFVKLAGVATIHDFDRLMPDSVDYHRAPNEPKTYDFSPDLAPGVYNRARKAVLQANRKFRFDIDGWQQPLRFNVYTPGQGFPWHTDYTQKDNSKLALIHIVQAAEEGGDLQLMARGGTLKLQLHSGWTLVFPAYIAHSITPVVKGRRVALAGWATGPMFR